ncbi:hypothetical protein HDV00_003000 [Rhizophlyctis rosea]|nr:hypothetical protein HDV00_003000 [Rhizophlyctis rosea]
MKNLDDGSDAPLSDTSSQSSGRRPGNATATGRSQENYEIPPYFERLERFPPILDGMGYVTATRHHICPKGDVRFKMSDALWKATASELRGENLRSNNQPDRLSEKRLANIHKHVSQMINAVYEGPEFYGQHALHLVVMNGTLADLKYLVNAGADVHYARASGTALKEGKSGYYGQSVLALAATLGRKAMVKYLLETCKCDPNAIDTHGNTVLHILAQKGMYNTDIAQSTKLQDTNSATNWAPSREMRVGGMWKMLVDAGADPTKWNGDGFTPLHMAVLHRQRDMVQAIIEDNATEEWKCGNRIARLYPLTEIDTYILPETMIRYQETVAKNAQGKNFNPGRKRARRKAQVRLPPRAIELAIWNEDADLINSQPLFYHVLRRKWKTHGRAMFRQQLFFALLYVLVVSVVVYLLPTIQNSGDKEYVTRWDYLKQDTDEDIPRYQPKGYVRAFFEAALLAFNIYFAIDIAFFTLDFFVAVKESRVVVTVAKYIGARFAKIGKGFAAFGKKVAVILRLREEDPYVLQDVRKRKSFMKHLKSWRNDWEDARRVYLRKYDMWQQTNEIILVGLFVSALACRFWVPDRVEIENILLGLIAIIGWANLLHFSKGTRPLGTLILILYQLLFSDLVRFMAIYLTLLAGFSQALYLQLGDASRTAYVNAHNETWTGDPHNEVNGNLLEWARPDTSVLMLMRWLMTQYDYDDLSLASTAWFAKTLWVIFCLLVVVLLLNVLIAMLNRTYTIIEDNAQRRWTVQWATMVMQLDAKLNTHQRTIFQAGFTREHDDQEKEQNEQKEMDTASQPDGSPPSTAPAASINTRPSEPAAIVPNVTHAPERPAPAPVNSLNRTSVNFGNPNPQAASSARPKVGRINTTGALWNPRYSSLSNYTPTATSPTMSAYEGNTTPRRGQHTFARSSTLAEINPISTPSANTTIEAAETTEKTLLNELKQYPKRYFLCEYEMMFEPAEVHESDDARGSEITETDVATTSPSTSEQQEPVRKVIREDLVCIQTGPRTKEEIVNPLVVRGKNVGSMRRLDRRDGDDFAGRS